MATIYLLKKAIQHLSFGHKPGFLSAVPLFLLLLLAVTACKQEDVLPAGQQDIRVNYYAASDVLAEAGLNVDIALYADTLYQQHKTAFRFEQDWELNIYPRTYQYSDDRQISYAYYSAQPYRFVFNGSDVHLIDTLVDLKPLTYHCLYLADALTTRDATPRYHFLAVTEPRSGVPEGRTGVRFINLSPELRSPQANLTSGTLTHAVTPAVGFLQTTDYYYFEEADASNGLLRFKLEDTDGTTLYAGVPFSAGRSYAVILQGFKTEQRRQVTKSNGQETITIHNNLRTTIRRTY